ncbi:MAG: hypothetical protein ACLQU4_10100, partial [Limisphaerales bacterium]
MKNYKVLSARFERNMLAGNGLQWKQRQKFIFYLFMVFSPGLFTTDDFNAQRHKGASKDRVAGWVLDSDFLTANPGSGLNHREHKVVLWFGKCFFIKVIHRGFRPVLGTSVAGPRSRGRVGFWR